MPQAVAKISVKFDEWAKEVGQTRILTDVQRKFLVRNHSPQVYVPFSKGWVESRACNPTLMTDEKLLKSWLSVMARMPGTRGLPDEDWWVVAESLPALAIVGEWLERLKERKW